MNDVRALSLDDPSRDLIDAVQSEVRLSPSLVWLKGEGDAWCRRADPNEPPPWLGLLALSVLVAARQIERGSLAFYKPFSDALGAHLGQEDYEATLFNWWIDLAKWLTEVNDGGRGLPSWRRIPTNGPRCIIGHPYTQILLRRADFRDIDAFLSSLGDFEEGDLEVTDLPAAGSDLMERFSRWATQRRVSPHLWSIINGKQREAKDSLQYILLDRLLDEVEPLGAHILERQARLLVTLDDWIECRLGFSVVGPSSMESWTSTTLKVEDEIVGPLEVGVPWPVAIPVDSVALGEGLIVTTPEDVDLVYRPSEVVALAVRDWSLWCSVDDVEIGETVYLLVSDGAIEQVRRVVDALPPSKAIRNVPTGWTLFGPGPLATPTAVEELALPVRRGWQAVPRLLGGLEVARRAYLMGGPPAVFVPAGNNLPIRFDGASMDWQPRHDSLVELAVAAPGPGQHRIDVGPYRLLFEMLPFESVPVVQEDFGRTALGDVVPIGSRHDRVVFCGAIRLPPADYVPPVLVSTGFRIVLLGDPGRAIECPVVTSAAWARAVGLLPVAFEPNQRTSYVGGERPLHPVRWVALQDRGSGAWSLVRLDLADETEFVPAADGLAREVVLSIGSSPAFLTDGERDESALLNDEWRIYTRDVIH